MAKMSPLRRRMIEDMMLRNLSLQTQQSHIYAGAKFSRHFNRPRDQLGMEDVRAYQLYLVGRKYASEIPQSNHGPLRRLAKPERRHQL
jgi:integrase/recombinase XerD